MSADRVEGSKGPVILSEANHHLEGIELRKMILRCAQDDTVVKHPCLSL